MNLATATPAEPDSTRNGSEASGAASGANPPPISAGEMRDWQERIRAAEFDDAALLLLAQQAPTVPLKLTALEALTQENSFKQAMQDFREQDKRLYRAAKSRWEKANATRTAVAEANTLIAGARALLEQEVVPVNRVVELDRAWAALNAELLGAELPVEFAALSEQLGIKVRTHGERAQTLTRWLSAVDTAIEKLRAVLPGVAQGDIPPAEAETLALPLLELVHSAPDPGDARCSEKVDGANRLLALASSVAQRAKFLHALPATDDTSECDEASEKMLIEQWRGFPELSDGGANDSHTVLAARFADWRNAITHQRQRVHDAHGSQERERRAEQTRQRVNALQRDIEAAELAHAGGHIADLTRLLSAIDHALKRGSVNAALTQRIESLRREQRRLQDWQRWSGGQGREQLASEAQAIAEAANGKVAIKAHADAIGKLRERWKELDKLGGAPNQAAWLAFDGALKSAYAPVAAHLDKLKLERIENLAKREQIVESLTQAAAKCIPAAHEGDASAQTVKPDWRAIAHALEEAQVAWRKLGPVEHTVPRKALRGDNAVTTRYATVIQALQAPLQNAYGEASRQREQLIAAAKELGGPAAVARDAVDKVRKLQTQWQAVAKAVPLPRRDENALWAAFKAATDALFTARDAARAAGEAEFSAKLKAREAVIERLHALASAPTAPDVRRGMAEAESAWRASPEVPRPQAAKLDARYRAARDAATQRIAALAVHATQARFDALIAAMALCEERETVSEEQHTQGTSTDTRASDLEARWNAVEHLPEAWKTRLEARFRGLSPPRTVAPARAFSDAKSTKKPVEGLPEILLNLEIACGIDSPPEFLAARQQLKIRALKNAMEGRQTSVTTPADIERWLLDAAATPHPDETARARLAKIIAAVRVRRPG